MPVDTAQAANFDAATSLGQGVPPFVVLHNSTLRELARLKPPTVEALRDLRGIGERKLADFGVRLIEHIAAHHRQMREPAPADGRDDPAG